MAESHKTNVEALWTALRTVRTQIQQAACSVCHGDGTCGYDNETGKLIACMECGGPDREQEYL